MIQKRKERTIGEDKIYAMFKDLKTAFGNVNREILWKILKDKGVKKNRKDKSMIKQK